MYFAKIIEQSLTIVDKLSLSIILSDHSIYPHFKGVKNNVCIIRQYDNRHRCGKKLRYQNTYIVHNTANCTRLGEKQNYLKYSNITKKERVQSNDSLHSQWPQVKQVLLEPSSVLMLVLNYKPFEVCLNCQNGSPYQDKAHTVIHTQ